MKKGVFMESKSNVTIHSKISFLPAELSMRDIVSHRSKYEVHSYYIVYL